jgi:hypothetical protein
MTQLSSVHGGHWSAVRARRSRNVGRVWVEDKEESGLEDEVAKKARREGEMGTRWQEEAVQGEKNEPAGVNGLALFM